MCVTMSPKAAPCVLYITFHPNPNRLDVAPQESDARDKNDPMSLHHQILHEPFGVGYEFGI